MSLSDSGSNGGPVPSNLEQNDFEELHQLLQESFPGDPPQLQEMVDSNPKLQKLSDLIHRALAFSNDTEQQWNVVELAVRHLLMSVASAQSETVVTRSKRIIKYSEVKTTESEQDTVITENSELKAKLSDAEEKVLLLQSRVDQLQNELESSSFTKSLKSELECESRDKINASALEERYHEALGQLKISETSRAGVEEQNRKLTGEYEAILKELNDVRQHMSAKREKIRKLKVENQNLRGQLAEKDEEMIQLQAQTGNEEPETTTEPEISMSQETLKLTAENGKLAAVIEDLTVKVNAMQKEQRAARTEKSDLLRQIHDMKHDIAEKTSECESLKSQLTSTSQEVKELETAYDELQNALDEAQRNIQKSPKQQKEKKPPLPPPKPQLSPDVERLKGWVNGYAAFITYLIDHEEIELHLLNGIPEFPERMANLLAEKVNQAIRFVRQKGMCQAIPLFDAAFGNPEATAAVIDNLMNSEDALPAFSVFATITKKLITQVEANAKKVATLCELLHIEPSTEDKMLDAIIKFHMEHQPVFDRVVSTMEQTFEMAVSKDNILACLNDYIVESSDIVEELQNALGQFVDSDCRPVDIPKQVAAHIDSLNKRIVQLRQRSFDGTAFQHEFREIRSQLAVLSDKLETTEAHKCELEEELKKKQECIAKLTDRLNTSIGEAVDNEQKLETLRAMIIELQSTCQRLKNERDRLKLALADKTAAFDRLLEEAIETERSRHEQECARQAQRFASEQELSRTKLAEKSKKLADVKNHALQLEQRLNDNKEKYSKIIADLRDQNASLVKEKNAKQALSPEDRKLIATANNQRRRMLARLNELSPSKVPMEPSFSIEDNLVDDLGQMLDQCFETSSGWTGRTIKKAIGILIERVLADVAR